MTVHDRRKFIALVAVTLVLIFGAFGCNAVLCDGKGGALEFSLLNSAGYACVDDDGRVITIP